MGNWGEDFLEKTFNISYDDLRSLLKYQYFVETKEKADKSNTKDKKESNTLYIDALYKDLSSPFSARQRDFWESSLQRTLTSLDKYEIGKEYEDKSIFETSL